MSREAMTDEEVLAACHERGLLDVQECKHYRPAPTPCGMCRQKEGGRRYVTAWQPAIEAGDYRPNPKEENE